MFYNFQAEVNLRDHLVTEYFITAWKNYIICEPICLFIICHYWIEYLKERDIVLFFTILSPPETMPAINRHMINI